MCYTNTVTDRVELTNEQLNCARKVCANGQQLYNKLLENWGYRPNVLQYKDKVFEVCDSFRCDKTTTELEESWNDSLKNTDFTADERSKVIEIFRDTTNSVVSSCDACPANDAAGVQWHGILLVAALVIIFVAIFIRGKRSNRTFADKTAKTSRSSRDEDILDV